MNNTTVAFVKKQRSSLKGQNDILNACKKMAINVLVKYPDRKSLMFTSCSPGSGTSSIVSFLARYAAEQLGKKVLLIDANLEAPVLHEIFQAGNPTDNGGFAPRQTDQKGIDLLPAAALQRDKERSFPSAEFQSALKKLAGDYDLVLVDTASATICPETLFLANMVDGVVLLIEAEKTRQQVAAKAKEDLEGAGATLVGAILNRRTHAIPAFLYRSL